MNSIFMRFPEFKSKCLTLSYDDGMVYDKKLIEIMSAYGLKGTFNVNSGWFSREGDCRMSADDTLKLYSESGNEVAVHGAEHLPLAQLDTAAATNEILSDRLALEKLFCTLVKGSAYAYGSYSNKTAEILRCCGIDYARTVLSTGNFNLPENFLEWHPTCHHGDKNLMSLAESFVNEEESPYYWINSPKLFYVWGHSGEFEFGNNWDIIEKFAKYMGGRQNIWYATNGEIFELVTAFNALRFSADGHMVENPTAMTLYITYYDKNYTLSPGSVTRI